MIEPILTTITPYWDRPVMRDQWLRTIEAATIPEVVHYFIEAGRCIDAYESKESIIVYDACREFPKSIGYYHNMGAEEAETEWIMKLDVDCMANPNYFRNLIPILAQAKEREWFNGGMLYLRKDAMPLGIGSTSDFDCALRDPKLFCESPVPGASNFICRREDYLKLGGCLPEFEGYGWEDYQQLYMLEHYRLGRDPFLDVKEITLANVTQLCRERISRPKALELWKKNINLVLLHAWHAKRGGTYRANKDKNKQILLNFINKHRK